VVKHPPSSYLPNAAVTGGTGMYKNGSGQLTISGSTAHSRGEKDVSTNNVTGTLNFQPPHRGA
jgi:hypothetical protein